MGMPSGQGTSVGIVYGPYHRIESPSQSVHDASMQEASGQVWGKPARWSNIPSVKAYRGPLPDGARGIEFTTPTAPHIDNHPTLIRWLETTAGVSATSNGFVWIPVNITKNTQV